MQATTRRYRLDWALLPQGWTRDVVAAVDGDGVIRGIGIDGAIGSGGAIAGPGGNRAAGDAERVAGYVAPGMPNAHSHAFQRALAGTAEFRSTARDSFWTWRRAMYRLANRLDAADLGVLATQLFVEMLESGYTSVAEFHYLHRTDQADGAGLRSWDALSEAAQAAGIGLTLLPTLYHHADFGAAPLREEQRRFRLETAEFLEGIAHRIAHERRGARAAIRTGAAFHSLRAVAPETIREATGRLREIDPDLPIHIHVAEQAQEVRNCLKATGERPVELLLGAGVLDERWCLVHCTHATRAELAGLAATGATVCIATTTEANLGDGFFDLAGWLRAGGRWCVGSDSQSTVDPAEELRWLEYQQRLRRRRRVVLAGPDEPHAGTQLWRAAARGGARALAQPVGEIAIGRRADWIVLDPDHPALAGAAPAAALDHLLFAGGRAAIRDCCVAGRWVVKDGRHVRREEAARAFGELMRRLAAS